MEKFAATVLDYRLQKVQRISFSRPFIEFYRIKPGWDAWRRNPAATLAAAPLAEQPGGQLLPRGVLYPEYAQFARSAASPAARSSAWQRSAIPGSRRSLATYGPAMKGYPPEELAADISEGMQHFRSVAGEPLLRREPPARARLAGLDLWHRRFGEELDRLPGLANHLHEETWLAVVFDEVLSNGNVDFKRLGCVNVVTYKFEPGTYEVETIEPYTLRYAKLMCLEGQCSIDGFSLREFAHPPTRQASFAASDERLNRIYLRGRAHFPRERAGYLHGLPLAERGGISATAFSPPARRPI